MEVPDIRSEEDIRTVVDAFYDGIAQDPVIGGYFARLDMAAHLPKMYAFWSSVVFQTGAYHGRPFDAHLRLDALAPHHFERWIGRFEAVVDGRFRGPSATHMKARARQVSTIFQIKLGVRPLPILGEADA